MALERFKYYYNFRKWVKWRRNGNSSTRNSRDLKKSLWYKNAAQNTCRLVHWIFTFYKFLIEKSRVLTVKNRFQDLERRWKQETKNGTLGMSFKVFEHVHVIGTIHVDFGNHNLNRRSLCLNTAKFVKPVIHAKWIYHLSEEEYNEKLQSWISGVVRERYQKV